MAPKPSPRGGRTASVVDRLADELRAAGEAEPVGLGSLRGYRAVYVEIDGSPAELPRDSREASGVRVRRANGEIALYLTRTFEEARALLADARRMAADV